MFESDLISNVRLRQEIERLEMENERLAKRLVYVRGLLERRCIWCFMLGIILAFIIVASRF